MTEPPIIIIRPLSTIADFHAAEGLQRQVWPGSELDVIPRHLLTIVAHNGGRVLGGSPCARLLGCLLGFLGTDEGQPSRPALARLKERSHMLGVLRAYR